MQASKNGRKIMGSRRLGYAGHLRREVGYDTRLYVLLALTTENDVMGMPQASHALLTGEHREMRPLRKRGKTYTYVQCIAILAYSYLYSSRLHLTDSESLPGLGC
jgi:hypothetical protein